jgi:hypothetical protein
MAQKLFSDSLTEFTGELINQALAESIRDLKRFLGVKKLILLIWDEQAIAVPLKIPVELPPLGTFQNIDIRSNERVLVVLDLKQYPAVAPKVFPDRLDFPKTKLAHLYVARKGKPPAFCLVRGNLADWYSNKRLKDLYIRISNWLRDAATGELTEDGNQFDPVRLEGYSGTMIYDYDELAQAVNSKQSFFPGSNYTIGLFERNVSDNSLSFKLTKIITPENFNASYDEFKKEREKDSSVTSKKNYHFGYIVWSDEATAFSDYSVTLPDDLITFKHFCATHGIGTESLEKQIAELDPNVFILIPVITAVRRPKKIIGFSGNIEFFNYTLRVDSSDVEDGKIKNIPVAFYAHSQPLNRQKAKEISGFHAELGTYPLIVGCGALGSKIIMHLARSGVTNYLLADPDELSPHNLVRHVLLGNSEGLGKASALKKEIAAIYPYEKLPLLVAATNAGVNCLTNDLIKLYSWVLDFTASNAFFQTMIQVQFEADTRICRAFITDFGNLGVLYFEGKHRNPRIDDLQIMLYAQFRKLTVVAAWLKREKENEATTVTLTVGVGCNSETTVLSDDIVSLHSAYFSCVIKSESKRETANEGRIYLNEIIKEPLFSNATKVLAVPPMVVFSAINDPSWQIRIKPGIIEMMKREMGYAMPSETGGVFVGCCNYKTKTIHIVELIKAPPDSEGNSICFFRGIEGLPETIADVNLLTGNQLGYIGEWHTHPFGPNCLSNVDINTVKKFKTEFERLSTPLPVFLMVLTPTHILPYVF